MKQIVLVLVTTFFVAISFSQNNVDWTKEDRTAIYDECLAVVSKYKNITQEQKESISLCYLDDVTKKITKKDYNAKIEIEIKRLQDATIMQCAKNIGVELTTKKDTVKNEVVPAIEKPKKVINEGNFTKDDLVGAWKDGNSKMFFNTDGSFVLKMDDGESVGSTYYIDSKKDIVISTIGTLQVISFDGKTLKYKQTVVTKKNIISRKKVTTEIFTAERIE